MKKFTLRFLLCSFVFFIVSQGFNSAQAHDNPKCKRTGGQGSFIGDCQIRVYWDNIYAEAPKLDSICYQGKKLTGLTFLLPDQTECLRKGYFSYCMYGKVFPPAYTLTFYFTYSDGIHTHCDVVEAPPQVPDCSCTNSTNNLLTNGSFENGSTGYSTSGGKLTIGSGYEVCGNKNAFLEQSSGTAKIWQQVSTVYEGNTVTFKAYAGTHTPGITCSPKLTLGFYNSSSVLISSKDAVVNTDVDKGDKTLEEYTITATAPAGTVYTRVTGEIGCNTLKLDALCLTATPAPVDCGCVNNLLTNPSFENGTTGFTASNGKLTTGSGYQVCGSKNAFLDWTSGTAEVWQDVTSVTPGSTVIFKAYAGTHTPGISCSPKLLLCFFNSAGNLISTTSTIVDKDVDKGDHLLKQYTITAIAPLGTVTTRIKGEINCNTLKLDALCLTSTPGNTVIISPDINITYVNVQVPGNVSTNDKVPTGTTYGTPVLSSKPSGSTATINLTSTGTYTFVANVPGVYVYNVPVCSSGTTTCPTSLLTITVLAPKTNNPPVANTDIARTKVNTPVSINSLANDKSGYPGGTLNPGSVVVVTLPLHGTTSVNATTGAITYTPSKDYVGMDTLTYKVCDNSSSSLCATAKQIITVQSASAANTTSAADDYNSTPVNTAVSGNVKTNDTDAEGNTQTVTIQTTTSTGKGTLVLRADGTYTFTPVTGYVGPVSFIYTTCDNGTPQACANATLYILVTKGSPNLTPNVQFLPSITHGTQTIGVVVTVAETKNVATDSTITVYVARDPKYSITFSPSATTFSDITVSNSVWTLDTSNPQFYIFRTTSVIPGNGTFKFGFNAVFNPNNSSGSTTITAFIGNYSGGESLADANDNTDNDVLIYFLN